MTDAIDKTSSQASLDVTSAGAKSWRDVLKIHPACELFSALPADELRLRFMRRDADVGGGT